MSLREDLDSIQVIEEHLERLETVLSKVKAEWNRRQVDGPLSLAAERYRHLRPRLSEFIAALPPIDGWSIRAEPPDPDMPSASDQRRSVVADVKEYRERLLLHRYAVIRPRVVELMEEVDELLRGTFFRLKRPKEWTKASGARWEEFKAKLDEVRKLLGAKHPPVASWDDLTRHVRCATPQDVRAIQQRDWPTVRKDLLSKVHEDLPLPQVELASLHLARPSAAEHAVPLTVAPRPPVTETRAASSPVSAAPSTSIAAQAPLAIWQAKLQFLLGEEAVNVDPEMKFRLKHLITEAEEKIRALSDVGVVDSGRSGYRSG